ncbi:hypothetical protein NFI96_025154 [Prochilodus magdalenae]|nr:hypothetical protein NFI96_025154 [Prochilodus magdalenae]
MGDYGFGLLHTASISSSSSPSSTSAALLFGGAAFRSLSGSSPLAPASCPAPLFSDDPTAVTGSLQLDGGLGEGEEAGDGSLALALAPGERARAGDFKAQAQFCPARDLQEPQPPPPSSSSSSSSPSSAASSSVTAELRQLVQKQQQQPYEADAPVADPEAASPSPVTAQQHLQMDSAHLLSNGAGVLAGGLGAGFPSLPHQDMANPGGVSGPSSPPLTSFAAPWSVHTSSPPPGPQQQPPQPPPPPPGSTPNSEPDSSFYPALPSSMSPGFFQSFSPVPASPCAAVNVQGFGGPFSPQQPPQSRRSPGSPHMAPQQHGAFLQQRNNYNHHQPLMKQSLWGGHQGSGWSSGGVNWGRDHRRGGGMGVPGSLSQISPMKKPFSSSVIAPPKFPRSTPSLGPKSWMEENVFRTDNNSNTLLPLQVRAVDLKAKRGTILGKESVEEF